MVTGTSTTDGAVPGKSPPAPPRHLTPAATATATRRHRLHPPLSPQRRNPTHSHASREAQTNMAGASTPEPPGHATRPRGIAWVKRSAGQHEQQEDKLGDTGFETLATRA